MPSNKNYMISQSFVVSEDFGDEYVVLNLQTGKYFSFRGSASSLWRDLILGYQPHAILDELNSFAYPDAAKVSFFIDQLILEELLSESNNTLVPSSPSIFIKLVKNGGEPPNFEVFDDMADLILADPIHDVEEDIGWPSIRKPKKI